MIENLSSKNLKCHDKGEEGTFNRQRLHTYLIKSLSWRLYPFIRNQAKGMLQGTVYSRCFSVFWFASTRLTFQLSCPLRSSPSKWLNAGSAKGPKGRDEKRREMKRKEGTHASLLSPFFSSSLSSSFLWQLFNLWNQHVMTEGRSQCCVSRVSVSQRQSHNIAYNRTALDHQLWIYYWWYKWRYDWHGVVFFFFFFFS